MKFDLLQITAKPAELIKLPRKPPAPDHPFRKSISNAEWKLRLKNREMFESNQTWLNNWKSGSILWTNDLYSTEKLDEYGCKVYEPESKKEKKERIYNYYLNCI